MDKKEFSKLINKKSYQLFLMSSKVPWPFFFAIHTWFVVSRKGKLERWDSGKFYKPTPKKSWGNVYLGLFDNDPSKGMNINPFYLGKRYKSKLIGYIEGKNNSIASNMINFIRNNAKKYPYREKYHFLGPNSNTFIQWVLDHFPESNLKLPWNAIGKSTKITN